MTFALFNSENLTDMNWNGTGLFGEKSIRNLSNTDDVLPGGLQIFDEQRESFKEYQIWFLIIEVILILPTVTGNLLILACFAKDEKLRNGMNILIANLATADLLVGVLMIPFDLLVLTVDALSENFTVCLLQRCVVYTTITASVLSLFLISVERFSAVLHPYTHTRRFTNRTLYVLVAGNWILVCILGFLPLFGWREEVHEIICKYDVVLTNGYRSLMNLLIILSLLVNIILFLIVAVIALRTIKKIKKEHKERTKSMKKAFKKAKLMIFVSGIFAICWGPYCILSVATVAFKADILLTVRSWLSSLGLINSGLNWIVYGFMNSEIRKVMKDIVRCSK